MKNKEEKKEKSQNPLLEAFVAQYHARKRLKELARNGEMYKK